MPGPTTLRIELTWMNGLLAEGEPDDPDAEPEYELLDHGTGKPLGPGIFNSCRALEAYIAAHHPGCKRAPLPAAPPEELKRTQTAFALKDNPPPDFDVRPPHFDDAREECPLVTPRLETLVQEDTMATVPWPLL